MEGVNVWDRRLGGWEAGRLGSWEAGKLGRAILSFKFLIRPFLRFKPPSFRRVAFSKQLYYNRLHGISPGKPHKIQDRVSFCLGHPISLPYAEGGFSAPFT